MKTGKTTGYPSIDKPWLKYYSQEIIDAPLPECTIYEHVLIITKIILIGLHWFTME